jgi:hypothetical protein
MVMVWVWVQIRRKMLACVWCSWHPLIRIHFLLLTTITIHCVYIDILYIINIFYYLCRVYDHLPYDHTKCVFARNIPNNCRGVYCIMVSLGFKPRPCNLAPHYNVFFGVLGLHMVARYPMNRAMCL